MKKITAVCMVLVLLVALTGCGGTGDATNALDSMMTALKSGEKSQIMQYYDFDAETEPILAENKDELEQAILQTLTQMTYKVSAAEKVDKNTVKVSVEVTTLDFSEVMNRFVNKVMEMVASEEYQNEIGSMSQEAYQGKLAEQMLYVLAQNDIPTVSETLEVTMAKESGEWKMTEGKSEFMNAVFANLIQVVTSLV